MDGGQEVEEVVVGGGKREGDKRETALIGGSVGEAEDRHLKERGA